MRRPQADVERNALEHMVAWRRAGTRPTDGNGAVVAAVYAYRHPM
jgi:hypothetical protein